MLDVYTDMKKVKRGGMKGRHTVLPEMKIFNLQGAEFKDTP